MALRGIAAVIFAPFGWLVGMHDLTATVLVFPFQACYQIISWLDRLLGIEPIQPIVLTGFVIVAAIRLAVLPLVSRAQIASLSMQAVQPQMQEIREKYKNDRKAQALHMQRMQSKYGVNPIASCLPIVPLFILYPAIWALFAGMTVRGEDGAFSPIYGSPESALNLYLSSRSVLSFAGMDLTATLPSVGWCSASWPYLACVAILVATTSLSLVPYWKTNRGVFWAIILFSTFGAILVPALFVIIRIFDAAWLAVQSARLRSRRELIIQRIVERKQVADWDHD